MFSDEYREAITALANRCSYQSAASAFDRLPSIYRDALSHAPAAKILADVAMLLASGAEDDTVDRVWRERR